MHNFGAAMRAAAQARMCAARRAATCPATCALWAVVGLSGCDQSPEHAYQELYDTYTVRVSRVLEQPSGVASGGQLVSPPRYPSRRNRRIAPPDVRVGPLQAMRLSRCNELGPLIGQRNSVLGRVMAASQQLVYESRFLPAARACLSALEDDGGADSETLAAVRALVNDKADALAAAQHNAAFDSDEIASFFSLSAQPALAGPAVDGIQTGDLQILAALIRQAGDAALTDDEASQLEAVLSRLSAGGGGQVLVTVVDTIARLSRLSAVIHARLDRAPLCFDGHQNPKALVAQTVFMQQYAGLVQPQLTALSTHLDELMAGLTALDAATAEPGGMGNQPPTVSAYIAALEALNADFRGAVLAHVKAWQRLLGQCGLMPQRPASAESPP